MTAAMRWRPSSPWHAPTQKRLFPNCTYSTASTSWVICNNNWGKSIGRTRDIAAMNHHINDLKDGAKRLTPTSALRMHHHTIRSLEDAQIKVSRHRSRAKIRVRHRVIDDYRLSCKHGQGLVDARVQCFRFCTGLTACSDGRCSTAGQHLRG